MMRRLCQLVCCVWLSLGVLCPGEPALSPGSGWLVPGGSWHLREQVRVLLAGDSLMQSLGPQLCRALEGYTNLKCIPIGKKSTGLSRPDFYNWPKVLRERLLADKPHVVVMWVGTNDPQGIYGMSGLGEPCSKAWQKAYLGKIREVMRLVYRHGARLILMGPPTVGNAELDAQLACINRLMAWACQHAGVCYVDTRAILSNAQGRFIMSGALPDGRQAVLRTPDRVHITAEGNRRVMHYMLPYLSREIKRCFAAPSRGSSSTLRGRGKTQ